MRVLIFGAGAIGTYIGGSLSLKGFPVVFLETPEAASQISERGLHLKLQDGIHTIHSPVVFGSISECLAQGPFDIVMFAIKSFDTQTALAEIDPYKLEFPPVLCLQNGVENEQKIARFLGEARVISGTVTSAVGRLPSGEVVLERLRGVGIATGNPLAKQILAAFNLAGLNANVFASAAAMKWSKLLTNLLSNASSAILKLPPAEVFSHPMLYKMEIEQLRETLRVMKAMGNSVVNLPGTPVRLLAFAIHYLPPRLSQPLLQKAVGGGRGAKMPSLYLDLHGGRGKSEVNYLNGAVVRHGERLGISTPVNRLLNETLLGMLSGNIPMTSFEGQPDKLVKKWQQVSAVQS